MRWQPSLQIIPHYESEPIYIDALVKSIENKIALNEVPGIGWLENNKLQTTPRAPLISDLDSLPPIPYELFPMHYYRMLRMPKVKSTDFCFPLMSARGCSFKCTFCYRMDPGYRMRTPEPLFRHCVLGGAGFETGRRSSRYVKYRYIDR